MELFFPMLAKEDLEVMAKFLYFGKIICKNKSDLCRVVVNLTQFLGFPNYMDLRSISVNQNDFQQERRCEKGGDNKIKDMKKKHKIDVPIEDISRNSGSLFENVDYGSMSCRVFKRGIQN